MTSASKDKVQLSKLLCEAILNDDYNRVEMLLIMGADPNIIDDNDASAIHLAAGVSNNSDMFTALLLQYSADPNLRNGDGTTPILTAASFGHCRALELLIKAGGDVSSDVYDCEGNNALDLAWQSRCSACYNLVHGYSARDAKKCSLPYDLSCCSSSVIESESTCDFVTCLSSDQDESMRIKQPTANKLSESSVLDTAFCCSLNITQSQSTDADSNTRSNADLDLSSYTRSDTDSCGSLDDITSLSSLSSLSTLSSCLEHCVRIEECHVMISDDSCCSLIASQFVPDFENTRVSNKHLHDTENELRCASTQNELRCASTQCSYLNDSKLVLNDWKNELSRSVNCSDEDTESQLLNVDTTALRQVQQLSDALLRVKLMEFGESPGPIVSSTRRTHELKLCNYMAGATVKKDTVAEFPPELSCVLQQRADINSMAKSEEEAVSVFADPDVTKPWREGVQKCCFNYLLLDPRVTLNLPVRVKTVGADSAFEAFLLAVFYIGKGKRSRPYEHFKEAMAQTAEDGNCKASRKVSHILDIWKAGLGVISLHVFQNVIACEAYTREACMIDAIGLARLTNQCRGQLYGPASSWTAKRVRQAGVVMLNKAFNILIHEGERQIRLQDVRNR